jgi:phosphohistidine swiveling domain-containing protein
MNDGGKASGLLKLVQAGFRVPPFFVCNATWTQAQVNETITKTLPEARFFAIRSSEQNEDSKESAFAGQFHSEVGVARPEVFGAIARVQKSYGEMTGAVIVQEFIPSDTGGVLFTEVDKDALVINANFGLCQSVVSGGACDEYICSKSGTIREKTIPPSKTAQFFRNDTITEEQKTGESLSEKGLRELLEVAVKIQQYFGAPQDVEWCFKDGILYILQSRPITRGFNTGELVYYDSANIAESYAGIVLPLTCSFAELVYSEVYKDLLAHSGVSREKLKKHTKIFDSLLGFFYGRMYYTMNNWYRMAEFVPGYSRNKANFELMITSNIKEQVATSIQPSLGLTLAYPFIVTIKVLLFGFTAANFKRRVTKKLNDLRQMNFSKLSYQESIQLFETINTELLRRWYITLENDFFVMTYLGALKKMLGEEELQSAIVFPSKASEQVEALSTLSSIMQENDCIWAAIEAEDISKFASELSQDTASSQALTQYLLQFGGRFANELKLESVGVDEDPKKLFAVLRAYQNYTPHKKENNTELSLRGFKRLLFLFILGKFKKYASRREVFRLLRSNTFAMTRRLFRHMGSLHAKSGALNDPEDVFYLQLAELLDTHALKNNLLIDLVAKRKKEYAGYGDIVPPSHFSTKNAEPPPATTVTPDVAKTIQARGASPGVVRGKVKIFREFSMPANIDFDILVTSHTDPGWTSLIALSKGLIIEHGGVLSHASIVARELGIPTVIGASQILDKLNDYQEVEINGSTGRITLL